jgi:hypothetical protein
MRHILQGSGLPETIQSIEEAIALLDKHNETIADYINLFPALDEDDDFKAMVHYNSITANYLETLLNNNNETL